MLTNIMSEASTNEELAKMLCNLQHSSSTLKGKAKSPAVAVAGPPKAVVSSSSPTMSGAAPSGAVPLSTTGSPNPAMRFVRKNTSDASAASSSPSIPMLLRDSSAPSSAPPSSSLVQNAPAGTAAWASAAFPFSQRTSITAVVSDGSSSSSPSSPKHNVALAGAALALSHAKAAAASALTTAQSAALPSFPVTLYEMMQDSIAQNFEDIVSWQSPVPGIASSFKVHSTNRFVAEIMPRYFKQTKFKSFQRQLNIYNFQRVHDGPNRGGYYHAYFVRHAPELLKLVSRKRMSSSGQMSQEELAAVADVSSQAPVPAAAVAPSATSLASILSQPLSGGSATNPISSMLLQAFTAAAASPSTSAPAAGGTDPQQQQQLLSLLKAASATEEERQRMLQQSLLLLSAANTAGLATTSNPNPGATAASAGMLLSRGKPATATATSTVPGVSAAAAAPLNATSANSNQHVFPWKLYKVLEEAPANGFDHIVSWVQNGSAFKVHNAQGFLAEVIYQYFDQSKYESFRRQLNLYGFTRVVRGQHRGVYSHPFFRRGHQDWCRFITRQQTSQLQGGNVSDEKGRNSNKGNNHGNHNEQGSSPVPMQAAPTPPSAAALRNNYEITGSATNSTSV